MYDEPYATVLVKGVIMHTDTGLRVSDLDCLPVGRVGMQAVGLALTI